MCLSRTCFASCETLRLWKRIRLAALPCVKKRQHGNKQEFCFCILRMDCGNNPLSRQLGEPESEHVNTCKRMKWYYVENGNQAGPVEEAELGQLLQSRRLAGDTLVWHEGMANWEPFSAVCPPAYAAMVAAPPVAGAGSVATATEAVCAECGGVFNKDEMIPHGNVFICARCKPVFIQKLAEGAKINTGELNYAGFGIRFAAKILDGLLLGVVIFAPMMILIVSRAGSQRPGEVDVISLVFQLGFYVVNLLYTVFFLGKFGATPGKMVCKLKVVTGDGGKVGYGRAAGRYFAEMLSGMICYIGYLMVLFDKEERRALHDRICNTRVIHK